ncbi:MAG: tRNA pseudouridine(55) synthase TruB [Coriobacteriales bacterium]|jgi:tRNA pseudouridine55 synthase
MKRGTSGLCGVLAIDKPKGITSHGVVDRVRRITGERRVGHAGTLDPMATGLLLVGVGAATRLSDYLSGHDKAYRARIVFGVATDTDDAEGRVSTFFSNSEPGKGLEVLDGLDADGVLQGLVGPLEQLPPAYSAIKKNGVVAYKAAREGKPLELERRHVNIEAAKLVSTGVQNVALDDGEGGTFSAELPYWDVDFEVSKGTYIRSIARDLGQQLGCGAHLGALRRTAIADLEIDAAVTLDELEQRHEQGLDLPWCDPTKLLGFPVLELDEQQARAVSNGRELSEDADVSSEHVACVSGNRLLAVYACESGRLKPATVIPGGVFGVA